MDCLKVAAAQLAPIWGDRVKTTEKIVTAISEAASNGASLVAFGEGLLPGYPFWLSDTHASKFEDQAQKEIHSHYMDQAVSITRGDLHPIQAVCAEKSIACYLGLIERAEDRGFHSLYCTLAYIDQEGHLQSTQRKLMPTYEERLAWSIGDGNGLKVHDIGAFKVGGLNCWENWMPLARASLYAQGESLHIASWPGGSHNTKDLTPVIAKEGRSFVLSVSGVMRPSDYPKTTPHYDLLTKTSKAIMANGGSCIAAPNGHWLVAPIGSDEEIIYADIDAGLVRQERQNFDSSGHYSRPDVFELKVNRKRQTITTFED
ncbi:carbon-nitrogen hydrolase family protein [Temperatibacter marinus]|uniref:Carbon-nitrogen hydrolase family protein n=1 Tax=Temperatibacter marinus TaxID=1456591 RepID=A0AA52EHM7_9PROT|nr:carbon-nitrogen hydrolase family protein [Temperatibacter marinus]WND02697.1 carbon-nitrogen hydrolase family protein [Temperatibacter marinus]